MTYRYKRLSDGKDEPTSYSVRDAAETIIWSDGTHATREWLYKEIRLGRLVATKDETGYLRIARAELERFKATLAQKPHRPRDTLAQQSMRREYGRAGGHARAAKYAPHELKAVGYRRHIETMVDPDGELRMIDPREYNRRVDAEMKAQMAKVRAARYRGA